MFFSYAPSSVGGLDGWSLFVFRYAKLRPGISRGLGKLRLPSTTDRKQDSRLKKNVFILRTHSAVTIVETHGDRMERRIVRLTGERAGRRKTGSSGGNYGPLARVPAI